MTENKRYIPSHNGTEDGLLDKSTKVEYYGFDLANLVNKLKKENEELKQEIKRLQAMKEDLMDYIKREWGIK